MIGKGKTITKSKKMKREGIMKFYNLLRSYWQLVMLCEGRVSFLQGNNP